MKVILFNEKVEQYVILYQNEDESLFEWKVQKDTFIEGGEVTKEGSEYCNKSLFEYMYDLVKELGWNIPDTEIVSARVVREIE